MSTPIRSIVVVLAAGALVSGVSGCRHRVAERDRPVLPTVGSTSPAASSTVPSASTSASASSSGAISQQDLDHLNGILGSVGGAASSVRSAVAGDTASPQG
ncbi:MAG: hypothetical protein HOV83_13380 [Catenulispora sp.]|nr:hypothetical protein [Catenulispora sp.]